MNPRFRRTAFVAMAAALLSGAAEMACRPRSQGQGSAASTAAAYYCPMHTDYKSDKPGNCPICSMKLVPVPGSPAAGKASAPPASPGGMPGMSPGTASPQAGGSPAPAAAEGPPTINIPPERQHQIGVKFAEVKHQPARVEIRAVGRVAIDETRVAHVHTKVSGWIDEVFVNYVGQPVRKGQPLFTIYSPELVASQEEYLLALRGRRELKDSSFSHVAEGSAEMLRAARRRLELWDMTPQQIEALEKAGQVSRTVTVFSAVSGVVTERAAYHHGRTVTPDLDLYTIVDLSRVWVQAQVYEYEMAHVKVGQAAEIELPYDGQAHNLAGRVTFVAPFLDPKTRAVQVRMEFPNADMALKPESFVNVRLRRDLGSHLVVPKDAVMETGKGQYVFVDKGQGYLEPRLVTAGAEVEQGRIIASGLREGERVATAANFILDSESRLKGAFEAMGRPQAAAAGGTSGPSLKVDLTTSPSPAKVGKNTVRVKVKGPGGQPLAGAQVEVRLFMPQMGSMAPMEAKATLAQEAPGQYAGEIDIPMAWTWETTVTVRKDDKVVGTTRTSITAR